MNSFKDLTIEKMDSIRRNKIQSAQFAEAAELFQVIKEIEHNYNMGIIYPDEVVEQINEDSKISLSLIKQWDK